MDCQWTSWHALPRVLEGCFCVGFTWFFFSLPQTRFNYKKIIITLILININIMKLGFALFVILNSNPVIVNMIITKNLNDR